MGYRTCDCCSLNTIKTFCTEDGSRPRLRLEVQHKCWNDVDDGNRTLSYTNGRLFALYNNIEWPWFFENEASHLTSPFTVQCMGINSRCLWSINWKILISSIITLNYRVPISYERPWALSQLLTGPCYRIECDC